MDTVVMTEARAREILGDAILPDGTLRSGPRFAWPGFGADGVLTHEFAWMSAPNFTADELEAIAWWMRNHR